MTPLIDDDPRDCPDCGGTGYGGFDDSIEFCTCVAGEMAGAFHAADAKAYQAWVQAFTERKWGGDTEALW